MLWYKFTSICKYLSFFTPPLVGMVEYYDEHVCLCVCLHNHISGTTDLIFTKFFVHVTYVCGLGLLWRRSLPCWTSYFEGSFTSWLLYWPRLTVSTKEQSGVFLVVLLKKSLMQLLQHVHSVLWHWWLGIRKNIQPVTIEWWGVGVVICLERGADCIWSSWCHCHPQTPSSLASFKSRLVLLFWYRLT